MDDTFRIYVDQLREGEELQISESASPGFLSVKEKDLRCIAPVGFSGLAYIASDNLVLQLHVETQAQLPCSICNDWVSVPLVIDKLYLTKDLAEIKSGVYDFSEALREEILLQVPQFAECNKGACPKRKELSRYLKSSQEKEDSYHPFEEI